MERTIVGFKRRGCIVNLAEARAVRADHLRSRREHRNRATPLDAFTQSQPLVTQSPTRQGVFRTYGVKNWAMSHYRYNISQKISGRRRDIAENRFFGGDAAPLQPNSAGDARPLQLLQCEDKRQPSTENASAPSRKLTSTPSEPASSFWDCRNIATTPIRGIVISQTGSRRSIHKTMLGRGRVVSLSRWGHHLGFDTSSATEPRRLT